MTRHASPANAPLVASLAFAFAGTALTCLLLRELLVVFAGNALALGSATLVLPLGAALGARYARRFDAAPDPAVVLASLLGLFACLEPLAIILTRAAGTLAGLGAGLANPSAAGVVLTALAAFALPGALLGAGMRLAGRDQASAGQSPPCFIAAAAAALGAAFVQFVAAPKLNPVNAALDLSLGCAVAGIICAAAARTQRGLETRLSLLALGCVLTLPVSSLVNARTRQWEWGRPEGFDFLAVPEHLPHGLNWNGFHGLAPAAGLTALVCCLTVIRARRAPGNPAVAAMARNAATAALALTALFALPGLGGSLYDQGAGLLAALGAGLALGRLVRPKPVATSGLAALASGLALAGLALVLGLAGKRAAAFPEGLWPGLAAMAAFVAGLGPENRLDALGALGYALGAALWTSVAWLA